MKETIAGITIIWSVATMTGCLPSLEKLKKPVKVVSVVEVQKSCTATFMGADGELYSTSSSGMCSFSAGQTLELAEDGK